MDVWSGALSVVWGALGLMALGFMLLGVVEYWRRIKQVRRDAEATAELAQMMGEAHDRMMREVEDFVRWKRRARSHGVVIMISPVDELMGLGLAGLTRREEMPYRVYDIPGYLESDDRQGGVPDARWN